MKRGSNLVAKTLAVNGCCCCRGFSSSSVPLSESPSHPTFTIWSSCEGLPGKTLVAAGLAYAVVKSPERSHFHYIKPLETRYPWKCDSRLVHEAVSLKYRAFAGTPFRWDEFALLSSNRVADPPLAAARGGLYGESDEILVNYPNRVPVEKARRLICQTLYAWKATDYGYDGVVVEDHELLNKLRNCFQSGAAESEAQCWTLIETQGGVATPAPSGTLQCDLYRPFGIPAILVGDGRRCGISATISAYESLKLRGYDVVAVVQEDCDYAFSRSYLPNGLPVLVLPTVTDDLIIWLEDSRDEFASLKQILWSAFYTRCESRREISYDIKEKV